MRLSKNPRTERMRRAPSRGTAAFAVLLVTLSLPRGAFGWVSDPWLTTKVKIALFTTKDLDSGDVNVDTLDGRVSLHGKVPSAADKAKVVAVARSIDGVSDVRDLLQVVAPGRRARVTATDAWVGEHVAQALEEDVKRGGSRVSVRSVNDGVVQLGGQVPNAVALLRAIEVTRRVPGTRRVENGIEIAPGAGDVDIWTRNEFRQDSRGILDVAADLWLSMETRLRLLADPRTPALDVNVDCRDHIVTLFGTVPSRAAKRAAEEDARAVPGVWGSKNELQVVPEARRVTGEAKDAELQEKVSKAIHARPEMKRASIHVAVRNGVVRLTGTVPSHQHRLSAAIVARRVPGTRAVEQDLQVTSITKAEAPGPTAP